MIDVQIRVYYSSYKAEVYIHGLRVVSYSHRVGIWSDVAVCVHARTVTTHVRTCGVMVWAIDQTIVVVDARAL